MEQRISIERLEQAVNIFGSFDSNIRLLEQEFHVTVVNRDGEIRVEGEPEETLLATKAIQALLTVSSRGEPIGEQNVRYIIGLVRSGKRGPDLRAHRRRAVHLRQGPAHQAQDHRPEGVYQVPSSPTPSPSAWARRAPARPILPWPPPSRPSGTSRSTASSSHRPAVEAGERLGFLPGDLQSKVDPYLRPLYDALFDMLGAETYQKYLERGNIEVAPLAYMRGRTLDDSFIILDEAQNTSREQMKMFLTRLGFGSKIVITGDVTQIDLPDGKSSGLKEAMRVLKNVEGIGICELTNADVVRHVMVQRIVEAYERYETREKQRKGAEVMAKRHYIPVTADVPGAASQGNCALIRKVIRTALAAEGVDFPCEVDVLLTGDSGIHAINREMRQVDRPTDVLSFPEFDLKPGELPGPEECGPGHRSGPSGGHGDLHGACGGPGQGVRTLQPPGALLSGGPLGAAPAGV